MRSGWPWSCGCPNKFGSLGPFWEGDHLPEVEGLLGVLDLTARVEGCGNLAPEYMVG